MMTKFLLLTVVVSLVFTGYGCGNSASLEESYDDGIGWIDRTPLEATQEVDGITFKYSLLNEKGEPSNRFKQGENFSFHFEMTNQNHPDSLHYEHALICALANAGFGTIISTSNDTIRLQVLCTSILEYLPLYGTLNHFEKTLPNTCTAFPDMDDDQPLPSGRYYTDLTNTFNFILPFHGEKNHPSISATQKQSHLSCIY